MTEIRFSASRQLPGKVKWGGYLYVIDFDNSVIKVGATANPRVRISSHERSAGVFGVACRGGWLSPWHDGHYATESKLISIVKRLGGKAVGAESFSDVDLAEVVARARRLRFPEVDEAAHEALATSRANAFMAMWAKAQEEGRARAGSPDNYLEGIHRTIAPLFGADGDGGYRLPAENLRQPLDSAAREQLEESLQSMADITGIAIDELLEWDYIDVLQHIVTSAVRTEALHLKVYALKNGRSDLSAPLWDIRDPTNDPDHENHQGED